MKSEPDFVIFLCANPGYTRAYEERVKDEIKRIVDFCELPDNMYTHKAAEAGDVISAWQELEENKKELESQLKKIANKDEDVKDNYKTRFLDLGRDEEDNVEEFEEYDRTVPLEHKLEVELKKVNQALAKIEKEEYGKCEGCGKEIDFERLKVRPQAGRCIQCKQQ